MRKYIASILVFLTFAFLLPVCLAGSDKVVLRVGVASMITPVSAVRYYQQIVDYLAAQLGVEAEMIHRTTYDEIDHMLEQKQVDVAFICSAPYVIDNKKFGVELLVAPQVDGKVFYQSNIIVHRDSGITSFEELKGKTFAFVDPKSNSGRLFPIYWLATRNLTPDDFFSKYFFSYSHNKSVEMVAKKKVDGAAVDSIVYAFMRATNSPYALQTKIVHQSPEFGIPPVVVPPGQPLFLKEKLREVFLSMHENASGRKILEAMRIERFVEVPDSNYDPIRKMQAFINRSSTVEEKGEEEGTVTAASKRLLINFGVVPRDNPRIAYERYQPLLDYLSAETGYRFELLLKNTYQETVNSLGSGESYFALLGPLTYLDAYARFGTPPIAKTKTGDDNQFYRSVIIAGADADIDNIEALAGRKVAFASLWSTSGNLIPRYMLAWDNIHLDKLSTYHNFSYHDTVVKKVLSGEFDAGGVRKSVADRYLPYGLKIIAVSDPIPTGPVVVSPSAPYYIVRNVQNALLSMSETEKGKEVLARLDPDLQGGFVAASDADYTGIRKMINDVPKTCGLGCHPKTTF
ncbi:MAG: hypothetical protein Kow0089_08050 [Desulfobulbaceae bacterium]